MENKELSKYFEGKGEMRGFVFTQIAANDRAYLYQVARPDGSVHYEAFERKLNTLYGNIQYPKSISFGKWAFLFYSLQKAQLRFEMISRVGDPTKMAETPSVELKTEALTTSEH